MERICRRFCKKKTERKYKIENHLLLGISKKSKGYQRLIISGLVKLGCKVITLISALPLTVSDNPNGVQSIPNFAKPPGRYLSFWDSAYPNRNSKNEIIKENNKP